MICIFELTIMFVRDRKFEKKGADGYSAAIWPKRRAACQSMKITQRDSESLAEASQGQDQSSSNPSSAGQKTFR